jgi:hypothetical protein
MGWIFLLHGVGYIFCRTTYIEQEVLGKTSCMLSFDKDTDIIENIVYNSCCCL